MSEATSVTTKLATPSSLSLSRRLGVSSWTATPFCALSCSVFFMIFSLCTRRVSRDRQFSASSDYFEIGLLFWRYRCDHVAKCRNIGNFLTEKTSGDEIEVFAKMGAANRAVVGQFITTLGCWSLCQTNLVIH